MGPLPAYIRGLFWEGLAEEPDPDAHPDYLAIRVLEAGDEPSVRWLLDHYGRERVQAVVASGRLRPGHEAFWRRVLS